MRKKKITIIIGVVLVSDCWGTFVSIIAVLTLSAVVAYAVRTVNTAFGKE